MQTLTKRRLVCQYHLKLGKIPKCPLLGDWVNKLWYIYIMEYSQQQNNYIQISSTIWMYLIIIMWVKETISKRELTLCFHVYEISRIVINVRIVAPSGGENRLRRSRREAPRMLEMYYTLTWVVIARVYTYVKTHQTVSLMLVHFKSQ